MSAIWKLEVGKIVEANQELYEITHILDLNSVLAKNLQNGRSEKLEIIKLKPNISSKKENRLVTESNEEREIEIDLGSVSKEQWDEAVRRAESAKYLLSLPQITVTDVDEQAEKLGVSRATMYRYLNRFLSTEKTSALIPNGSDGGRGKTRIVDESERILEETINEYYLTRQNPKTEKTYREYKRRCLNAGVKPVHENTLRNRIKKISEPVSAKKRQGKSAAQKFEATPGKFPEGHFPMEVTQIDHTPIDLQFVDDENRLSIGRFYLTVLIEVFSRMILGFYISPDKPSIMSVGMCLAKAILPKEEELARLGVKGEWKCWGLMNKIHADNAGEFRGEDLKRVCQEYDVDLEWRPVGRPHYGSHIERLLETFMDEVHHIPGTTFSNIEKKGDYDSEKEAIATYDEFEKWLTTYVVGYYHKKTHTGIGMPPEVMYERGLFIGSNDFPPTGFPPQVTDERKLRIDLLPSIERTVQRNGVEIDLVNYYDPILNPFIGAKDPKNPKLTRKFIFKRNPRHIRKIYFYHPELKQYFEIPYRNLTNPDATIWEVRAAHNKRKDEGKRTESEKDLFDTLNEMRNQQENWSAATKKARRERQNKKIYKNQELPSANEQTGLFPKQDFASVPVANNKTPNKAGLSNFFNISEEDIIPLEVEE